jgi:hypothetical protein
MKLKKLIKFILFQLIIKMIELYIIKDDEDIPVLVREKGRTDLHTLF